MKYNPGLSRIWSFTWWEKHLAEGLRSHHVINIYIVSSWACNYLHYPSCWTHSLHVRSSTKSLLIEQKIFAKCKQNDCNACRIKYYVFSYVLCLVEMCALQIIIIIIIVSSKCECLSGLIFLSVCSDHLQTDAGHWGWNCLQPSSFHKKYIKN